MGAVVAEFDVKKDGKNRIMLTGVAFDCYHAKVFDDGHIEFYPQIPADPSLSARTLAMMDSAMANLSCGKTSPPIEPGDPLEDFPSLELPPGTAAALIDEDWEGR